MSDSVQPHRWQPTRLPHPCSPEKNPGGVGYHFLLQCMKVKSESEVAQSCPTPSNSMDCSLPGSSIHGIFQARVLEWGAIAFSLSEAYPDLFKFGTILLTSGVPNFPTLFLAKTFITLKIITSLIIFMHLFILFLPF